ncbi:MAG: energy-coupling factor transporter ATPase [Coriobacteriales bacterium]|nr:energy-coupling factor transporter ATPase [Coriobacteriales bacterium]
MLALEGVSYTYRSHEGDVTALKPLDLTIEDGTFLGIIGHTGSGKSTLLQLMCGLLSPSSGRVVVDGENIADKRVRNRLHLKIGMAFQYPEYQLFAPTVAEDIAFGPRNAGLSATEVDKRVRLAMERLRLGYERFAHASPFELSGGEKRRAALAGVIATDPKLLILDEPTAGLDPAGRSELLGIIEEFNRSGMTLVMVSHSMDDIARLANRVLVLKDGAAVMQGTPTEVFGRGDFLRSINLGVPQATEFAAELRAQGFPLPEGLLTLETLASAIAHELESGSVSRGI